MISTETQQTQKDAMIAQATRDGYQLVARILKRDGGIHTVTYPTVMYLLHGLMNVKAAYVLRANWNDGRGEYEWSEYTDSDCPRLDPDPVVVQVEVKPKRGKK